MDRLSRLLLGYGILYCIFIILPAFLSGYAIGPITWGDAMDFLTPFVVLPFAYLTFRAVRESIDTSIRRHVSLLRISGILLSAGLILWIDGHGLHLGANSLSRFFLDSPGTRIYRAVYLFDEVISHYMWESGIVLISLALIILAPIMRPDNPERRSRCAIGAGASFYGFTFFTAGVEGQTVVFNLPAALASSLLAWILVSKLKKTHPSNPILLYFGTAYLISIVLFLVWALINGGFPEFSELGWIK